MGCTLIIPSFAIIHRIKQLYITALLCFYPIQAKFSALINPEILIINRLMHIIHMAIYKENRLGCALVFKGAKSRLTKPW